MSRLLIFTISCLMAFVGSTAIATTIPINLNIDNVSRVGVKVGVEELVVATGLHEYQIPMTTSEMGLECAIVTIYAKEWAKLTKVYNESFGIEEGIIDGTTTELMVMGMLAGTTWTVTSEGSQQQDTYFTIIIDNPQEVTAILNDNILELGEGENQISIEPNSQNNLLIQSGELFYVALNDQEVDFNFMVRGYFMEVAPYDTVEIVTQKPNKDYTIDFVFENDCQGFVESVTIDGEAITDLNQTIRTAAGSRIEISFNPNWICNEFLVNGHAASYYSNLYTATVKKDLQFTFNATETTPISFVIDAEGTDFFTAYYGYYYNNKVIQLSEGSNTLEVPAKQPLISIRAKEGCYISLIEDGEDTPFQPDYSNTYVISNICEGMVINVKAEQIVRDQVAYIYVDDTSKALNGLYFNNKMQKQFSLVSGYNKIEFFDGDNDFLLSVLGARNAYLYTDNELMESNSHVNNTWSYSFPLHNNEVVKLFLDEKSHPAEYHVSVKTSETDNCDWTIFADIVTDMTGVKEFNCLPGTLITLRFTSDPRVLKINGTEQEPENGSYTFSVNQNTDIEVEWETSNVQYVFDTSSEEGSIEVFSIDGRRITTLSSMDETSRLNSGLYIVKGKKIFIQ